MQPPDLKQTFTMCKNLINYLQSIATHTDTIWLSFSIDENKPLEIHYCGNFLVISSLSEFSFGKKFNLPHYVRVCCHLDLLILTLSF